MNVLINYMDGQYSAKPVDDITYADLHLKGCKVTSIQDQVYEAWSAHMDQHVAWNAYWCALDNKLHDEHEKRRTIWVVFAVPGVGEVKQGPFRDWERGYAVNARDNARVRYDSKAYYLNDMGERIENL